MNKELKTLIESMGKLLEESPQIARTVERALLLAYKVGITDTWEVVSNSIHNQMDAAKEGRE